MATRVKVPASQLYETDWYAWARAQAELLSGRRFDELALDQGESLHRSVRWRIQTIIEHLLKLEHSPTQDPRAGWYDTIIVQRRDLEGELTPSLRTRVEPQLAALYARSRKDTAQSLRRHGEDAAADALPAECPYSFEQIMGDWLP